MCGEAEIALAITLSVVFLGSVLLDLPLSFDRLHHFPNGIPPFFCL